MSIRAERFKTEELFSVYAVPRALERAYGSQPVSFMVFLRGALD